MKEVVYLHCITMEWKDHEKSVLKYGTKSDSCQQHNNDKTSQIMKCSVSPIFARESSIGDILVNKLLRTKDIIT